MPERRWRLSLEQHVLALVEIGAQRVEVLVERVAHRHHAERAIEIHDRQVTEAAGLFPTSQVQIPKGHDFARHSVLVMGRPKSRRYFEEKWL